jgi:hypothetical protein
MHWFDVEAFHREVQRVVRPGGIIAVWSYALLHATPAINDVINDLYRTTGPSWPADRVHVDNGYANLAFPYPLIPYMPPAMTVEFDVPLRGLFGNMVGSTTLQKSHRHRSRRHSWRHLTRRMGWGSDTGSDLYIRCDHAGWAG